MLAIFVSGAPWLMAWRYVRVRSKPIRGPVATPPIRLHTRLPALMLPGFTASPSCVSLMLAASQCSCGVLMQASVCVWSVARPKGPDLVKPGTKRIVVKCASYCVLLV